jgi:broad specificity phosphatase PhoE
MLKIYIVRHGETEFNVQKRMQGRIDSPLTQKGIDNANSLGKQLADIKFDKIYTSPSPRAHRTAELIKGERNIQIQTEDELREMNLAAWEGKSIEELELLYPEAYDIFFNSPQLFVLEGGETFKQVQDRAVGKINELISENDNCNILLVTHSVVIKTITAYFGNYPMEKLWSPPFIQGTSVTLMISDKGHTHLEFIADISHLE